MLRHRAGVLPVLLSVDAPADDPPGFDAEHLGVEARAELRASAGEHFGLAADLDSAHLPRFDRNDIVDDERDPRIAKDVTVFLSSGKAAVPADLDRIALRVVTETHRHDMGLGVWTDGGQAAQTLAA